jgi:hypothetical protein
MASAGLDAQTAPLEGDIMKSRFFSLAGALTLLAVLGKFYAQPLMAQVRAALIKNIDEKGRNPYIQHVFSSCSGTSGLCDLTYPVVPAGKRLVIERVSANIGSDAGINGTFLLLPNGGAFALPGRTTSLPSLFAVNEGVLAYYDAGQSPVFRIAISGTTPFLAPADAVIAGYMVDLMQ